MTIDEQVAQFVRLSELERKLKAALEEAKTKRMALEVAILDHWSNNSITGQRVAGVTVYPQRSVYASAPRDAVEAAGLHDLVSVSSASFSAWYREWERSGEPIPQELADCIKVTERTSLRTRRGF